MKVYFVNITQFNPSYGLAALAAYLGKADEDYEIRILDVNYDDVLKTINQDRPAIVGISSMTVYYSRALEYAERIKSIYNPLIIIGGVHISALPESFENCFDYAVLGEGEETTLELLKRLAAKKDASDIPGVACVRNGRLQVAASRPPITDINALPIPNWDYIHKDYFTPRYEFSKRQAVGQIMTSRGCPYQCLFCSTSRFWKKLRMFSVERVCEEIAVLYRKHNVTMINVMDDMFTISAPRLHQIADGLERLKIREPISKLGFFDE